MKFSLSFALACAMGLLSVSAARAEDKKEVTLKGEIVCAKCALKDAAKCTTAIVVKEKDKEVVYLLKDKGSKEEYHEQVCGGSRKQGTVIGVVTTEEGKKWITPTKVEYAAK